MNTFAVGDTVYLDNVQAIVEGFHKKEIIVYLIKEGETKLVEADSLTACDKYEEMVKSTEE